MEDLIRTYRCIDCKKLSPYCGRNLTLIFYLIPLYAYVLITSSNALLTLKPKLRLGASLQCTLVATILPKKILFKTCSILRLCQKIISNFSFHSTILNKNPFKKYNHIYLCKNIISHHSPTPTKGIRFARI